MTTEKTVSQIASIAKAASLQLAHLPVDIKNLVLEEMASALELVVLLYFRRTLKILSLHKKKIYQIPLSPDFV